MIFREEKVFQITVLKITPEKFIINASKKEKGRKNTFLFAGKNFLIITNNKKNS